MTEMFKEVDIEAGGNCNISWPNLYSTPCPGRIPGYGNSKNKSQTGELVLDRETEISIFV